jgi:dGTPase
MTIDEREQAILAPCALFSRDSQGRNHAETEHLYRGPYQRDRDRIVHSGAFRRLSDKTQVFSDVSDYHRTRLTHTMEVASIARTIGRALRLNEDFIEALALMHDIGHPPFGHAGEDALAECLRDDGGFSHNQHALTIVEELEARYARFPGLNLTRELLAGQATRITKSNTPPSPPLEVQVVDAADSITYDAHDTDDAIQLGLVALDDMLSIPLIKTCAQRVENRAGSPSPSLMRKVVVHELIDYLVGDVLATTKAQLDQLRPASVDEIRKHALIVKPSDAIAGEKRTLEAYLYRSVYRHVDIVRVRKIGQDRLRRMFDGFREHPEWMPRASRDRIDVVGLPRAIGEYLAGMTDGFCLQEYKRYFDLVSAASPQPPRENQR